jgi:Flp pilus assembly protein TadD
VKVLILALLASAAAAAKPSVHEVLVREGFDHFYNLEYDQAIANFERAIAQSPGDPDLHNHLAESLVFREMYRNGALESEMVSGWRC